MNFREIKVGEAFIDRQGRSVRIICDDRKYYNHGIHYPVVGLIMTEEGKEVNASYDVQGRHPGSTPRNNFDLKVNPVPSKEAIEASVKALIGFNANNYQSSEVVASNFIKQILNTAYEIDFGAKS